MLCMNRCRSVGVGFQETCWNYSVKSNKKITQDVKKALEDGVLNINPRCVDV